MSKEKLIIATSLDIGKMTEEEKCQLMRQTLGFDLTDNMGKVIGKVMDIEFVNPETIKIKAELHDEYVSEKIKNGIFKHMKVNI